MPRQQCNGWRPSGSGIRSRPLFVMAALRVPVCRKFAQPQAADEPLEARQSPDLGYRFPGAQERPRTVAPCPCRSGRPARHAGRQPAGRPGDSARRPRGRCSCGKPQGADLRQRRERRAGAARGGRIGGTVREGTEGTLRVRTPDRRAGAAWGRGDRTEYERSVAKCPSRAPRPDPPRRTDGCTPRTRRRSRPAARKPFAARSRKRLRQRRRLNA